MVSGPLVEAIRLEAIAIRLEPMATNITFGHGQSPVWPIVRPTWMSLTHIVCSDHGRCPGVQLRLKLLVWQETCLVWLGRVFVWGQELAILKNL